MYGVPGQEGTAPRTINELFDVIHRCEHRYTCIVAGSMLELYRDTLVDLLSKGPVNGGRAKPLNVKLDGKGGVSIENLTEERCHSAEELKDILERGNAQRTTAATQMNSESSRSHLVFMIKITSEN